MLLSILFRIQLAWPGESSDFLNFFLGDQWAPEGVLKEDMYLGITATCQGFYHPQGRSISNDPHFNSILSDLKAWKTNENVISNFEMETAGILGLARYFGFNACSINLILANRANQTFSKNPALKMNALIEQVLAKITL